MRVLRRNRKKIVARASFFVIVGLLVIGMSGYMVRPIFAADPNTVTIDTCQDFIDLFPDNTTHEADTIVLANDIDCTGVNVQPLFKSYEHPYTGTFNGQGHTISNLTMVNSDDTLEGFGLFVYVAGGRIQDLNLSAPSVQNSSYQQTAVLIANGDAVKLDNIHITNGLVRSTSGYAAGIIANSQAYTGDVRITNSSIDGHIYADSNAGGITANVYGPGTYSITITGNTSRVVYGANTSYLGTTGGIISNGYIGDASSSILIRNNHALAPDVAAFAGGTVGGIAGVLGSSSGGKIEVGTNTIEGNVSGGNSVGALIGSLSTSIRSARSTYIHDVHVTSNVTGADNVGGLIGYVSGNDSDEAAQSQALLIENVSSTGAVTGDSDMGGLIGNVSANGGYTTSDKIVIKNAYSAGNVHIRDAWTNGYSGGFIGYAYGYGVVIENSYAVGDVIIGTEGVELANSIYDIGGFVGYAAGVTIRNSFATGDTFSASTIPFMANIVNFVGGFVGYATQDYSASQPLVITNSYSTGRADGTDSYNVHGFVGRGADTATITSSYWDTETSEKSDAVGAEIGKTTAEMKQQATFSGWDFSGSWGINPSKNNGYPYLLFSQQFTPDVDVDGVPNSIENTGPNNGDGNNDGVRDSVQANVATSFNPTTNTYVTVASEAGTAITSVEYVSESANPTNDTTYQYPGGLIQVVVDPGVSGGSSQVELYFPGTYGPELVVMQYSPATGIYSPVVPADFPLTQAGQVSSVVFTATDGGARDTDGATNGAIQSPMIGLARPGAEPAGSGSSGSTPTTPTLTEAKTITPGKTTEIIAEDSTDDAVTESPANTQDKPSTNGSNPATSQDIQTNTTPRASDNYVWVYVVSGLVVAVGATFVIRFVLKRQY